MPRAVLAFRHVLFEDLGRFGSVLAEAGYQVRYHDVGIQPFADLDSIEPDLVIVLGAPIGVYETDAYPFLIEDIQFLKRRLEANRPTLGICLGAQLIACALGVAVERTGLKEIGFSEITLTQVGRDSPLRHLAGVQVLHWHGDTFVIPSGALHLATTPVCPNQAFSIGRNILGVQFHPEADAESRIEAWLVGHATELAGAEINPRIIRADARRFGAALRQAGRLMISEWLHGLEL